MLSITFDLSHSLPLVLDYFRLHLLTLTFNSDSIILWTGPARSRTVVSRMWTYPLRLSVTTLGPTLAKLVFLSSDRSYASLDSDRAGAQLLTGFPPTLSGLVGLFFQLVRGRPATSPHAKIIFPCCIGLSHGKRTSDLLHSVGGWTSPWKGVESQAD
jgi:hypothetical protein